MAGDPLGLSLIVLIASFARSCLFFLSTNASRQSRSATQTTVGEGGFSVSISDEGKKLLFEGCSVESTRPWQQRPSSSWWLGR